MIFSGIFKNYWHWKHTRGTHHVPTRVEGAPYPLGTPPALWAHGGPPPLIPAPTHSIFLPKNHYLAQARVPTCFATIFDLLAQSSIHKTALGYCSLVCDSSNDPISFCSSALFTANSCCLGDSVLELAC